MRQAVILIHGIGEQRPMSALRGFVHSVLRVVDVSPTAPWSKPDRMSETFEVRRLVARQARSRPATDFYEYYWAHHMEGTKIRDLWPLLRAVLLRWPHRVPSNLRLLWIVSWVLLAGAVFFLLKGRLFPRNVLGEDDPAIALALTAALALVQGFAVRSLGDAARYLSPLPGNIAARQRIRSGGVQLLRRLHRSSRYDRIVVVGHSLGSVIGYDVLTHAWSHANTIRPSLDRPRRRCLEALEKLGNRLTPSSSNGVREFQLAQRELWLEDRALGFPWLVTDFVTLGSPLAHAVLLLARDERDLVARQEQRELPTCPPVLEDKGGYSYVERYKYRGLPRSIRILHHAALFAPTRWTNIYFPTRLGVLGDWVGGPLRGVFGPGIRDVPVATGRARFLPLLSHTRYWRGPATPTRLGGPSALSAVVGALALHSVKWLPKRPAVPTPPSQGPNRPASGGQAADAAATQEGSAAARPPLREDLPTPS